MCVCVGGEMDVRQKLENKVPGATPRKPSAVLMGSKHQKCAWSLQTAPRPRILLWNRWDL